MKKLFPAVLMILLLIGCSSNEAATKKEENEPAKKEVAKAKEEKEITVPNLSNYETVTLEEKDEYKEIVIAYPKFSYEPIDSLLSKEMESQLDGHIEEAEKDLMGARDPDSLDYGKKYSFTSEFREPVITDEFVSIYFDAYVYMGGVHGMPLSTDFNFDLKENKLLTLDEVLESHGTSLETISDIVADELLYSEKFSEYRGDPVTYTYRADVKKETEPVENNFHTFTLTEESIIFYKQYYSLFPNAAGIVDVEVKWDEVEKREKEKNNALTYKNDEYNFTLKIPASWEGKYTVKKGNWNPAAELSYDFQFVHNGKEICNIFSINILDGESDESDDLGPMEFIASQDGKTFALTKIMEFPQEFMEDEELSKVQDEFTEMVNGEVPEIIETFSFE